MPEGDGTALADLYQELILDHYRRPRNKGSLEAHTRRVALSNPTCGDELELDLLLDGDTIADVRFSGRGCSISQASASMMTQLIKGKTIAEARALGARFGEMMHGSAEAARDRSLGEARALGEVEVLSGNVKLAMSHVVPDLVQKVVKGQDPLRILGDGKQIRHYTYGGDLARGIAIAIEHPDALNDDFNLSTSQSTTVLELAEMIWKKIRDDAVPFRYVSDPAFEHDVQKRVPSTEKAKRVLGFEATTSLSDMLDEVIPWVAAAVAADRI